MLFFPKEKRKNSASPSKARGKHSLPLLLGKHCVKRTRVRLFFSIHWGNGSDANLSNKSELTFTLCIAVAHTFFLFLDRLNALMIYVDFDVTTSPSVEEK